MTIGWTLHGQQPWPICILKDKNGIVTGGMGRSVETNSWMEAVIEHAFMTFIILFFLETYQQVDQPTDSKMEEVLITWQTGAPNGKELFSVITQLSIEQGICGGYSTSPADVLSKLEFMLSQKDGALQANTWDLTAQKHVEQLHNLVEASVSQDGLQQIFNQLSTSSSPLPPTNMATLYNTLLKAGVISAGGTSSTNHLHEVKPPETSTIDYSRDASHSYRKAVLSEKVKLTMADILGWVILSWCLLPMQCKQCGLRFSDDLCGKKQMDDHLDMHLRQNSGVRQNVGCRHSRCWFISLEMSRIGPGKRDAELHAQFVVVLSGDKAKSIYCLICKEIMKSKFLEDDEDWVWRDVVRKDDNHKVDDDGFQLQYQNMGQLCRDASHPHPLSFRMAWTKQTAKKCASGHAKPAQLAGHKRPQMSSTASFTPSSLSPLSSCLPSPDLQPTMIPNQSNRPVSPHESIANKISSPEIIFKCPACHEKEEHAAHSAPMPYFTVQGNTILASNEPTFINSVCERASKSQWSEAESLAAMIGEDIFQQKIFFISIHSKVTCGDLFAGKEGDGSDVAVRPEEPLVSGATIFMLSCGLLVASSESICSLKKALLDAKRFISVVIKSFIITFGIRVIIQGHDLGEVFKDLLDVSVELPMHTDMYHYPTPPMGELPPNELSKVQFHLLVVTIKIRSRPIWHAWAHQHMPVSNMWLQIILVSTSNSL
ncbi:hypothetical protein EDC04DRAFT_2936257 [Pisolithus marmoratus]|nr:hypothetical protein EDC04DRAFT_2936257 [Pisolithus marmoratus]